VGTGKTYTPSFVVLRRPTALLTIGINSAVASGRAIDGSDKVVAFSERAKGWLGQDDGGGEGAEEGEDGKARSGLHCSYLW